MTRSARRTSRLAIEHLEDRSVPAVTAFLNTGILTVIGDDLANNISVQADAMTGNVSVTANGANVAISNPFGGSLNRADLSLVAVQGNGGDDVLYISGTLNNGASPTLGPTANFSLSGGEGNDRLEVDAGGFNGTLVGTVIVGTIRGNAFMSGGSGNDVLVSGFGNDIMNGDGGNDMYVWDPGTLTDVWNGGSGFDTATINGNNGTAGDAFALNVQSNGRVLFQRTNIVQFSVDIGTTEAVTMNPDAGTTNGNSAGTPGMGNDTVTIGNLTGALNLVRIDSRLDGGNDVLNGTAQLHAGIRIFAQGGAGDDVMTGGAGNDSFSGNAGNDVITGNAGNDMIYGNLGNDTLSGDDGNDSLNGNDGTDTLLGGDDNDTLNGGGFDADPDVLVGGTGADTFLRFAGEPDTFADFNACEGDVFQDVASITRV